MSHYEGLLGSLDVLMGQYFFILIFSTPSKFKENNPVPFFKQLWMSPLFQKLLDLTLKFMIIYAMELAKRWPFFSWSDEMFIIIMIYAMELAKRWP